LVWLDSYKWSIQGVTGASQRGLGSKIFPAFKTLLGSNTPLIFRITSTPAGPATFSRNLFFDNPTPCSPVMVPPKSMAERKFLEGFFHALNFVTIALVGEASGMQIAVAEMAEDAEGNVVLLPMSRMRCNISTTRLRGTVTSSESSWDGRVPTLRKPRVEPF
jgi:hypothetical protein